MKYILRISLLGLFAFSMFYLQNCGTSTRIAGSWANPDNADREYTSVMVVALTDNIVARRNVEDQLGAELAKQGVKVETSLSVFPPNFMKTRPTKDEVLDKIRSNGHEGVLTVALVDQKLETRYVPGTSYAPMGYGGFYGSFGGYYGYYGPTFYDPGYYTTDKTYIIETNLYDAADESLVWSAQAETYDPNSPESGARSLAAAVSDRMRRDGVFKKD